MQLKSWELACFGSPSPLFSHLACLAPGFSDQGPPILMATHPHRGDHHRPPTDAKRRWSWVWSPGSQARAEWSWALLVSFIWDTHLARGCLGGDFGVVGRITWHGANDALAPPLACDKKLPALTSQGRDLKRFGRSSIPFFQPPCQTACITKPRERIAPSCLHYRLSVFVKLVYSRNIGLSSDLISRELDSCPTPLIWGNESQTGPSDLLGGEDDVQPCTYSLIYLYKLQGGGRGLIFASGGLIRGAVSLNLFVYIISWATSGVVGRMCLCACWLGTCASIYFSP